jgi:hypothetical protein
MTNRWKLALFGAVAFALGASCGFGDPPVGNRGTGGSGGTGGGDDAACLYQHYFSPGCGADVSPRCTGVGGACYSLACGCNGKIITGCGDEFALPYAYTILPVTFDGGDSAGMTCDPDSDAGK